MKPSQVKAILFERSLSVSAIARELAVDYPIAFDSLRVMIGDVLFGRRYFPRLAAMLNERYGFEIERPEKEVRHKDTETGRGKLQG
jgi:hypothetical protein